MQSSPIHKLLVVHDVKCINSCWFSSVAAELLATRVRNVHDLQIRRKLETVGFNESIGDHLNNPSARFKTINLLWLRRRGAEVLEVAVVGVGEPEVACDGVLPHVIGRGEIPSEKVGKERVRSVGARVDG